MSSIQALESLVPSLQSPVCWADEDQAVLVCTAVSDVSHDVKIFVFRQATTTVGTQVSEIDHGSDKGNGFAVTVIPLAPSRAKSSSWLINESRERPAVAIVPAIVL